MNLNRDAAKRAEELHLFPILIAFFTAAGKCLMKSISSFLLPFFPSELQDELDCNCADKAHRQMRWTQFFQIYDTAQNVLLDARYGIPHTYTKLKSTRWRKTLAPLNSQMDSPHFTKIVQFYYNNLHESPWVNPAVVSYYYDDKLLCKYNIFVKLKSSFKEVLQEMIIYRATKYERNEIMRWVLWGRDIKRNPLEEVFNGDFIHYLREETSETYYAHDRLWNDDEAEDAEDCCYDFNYCSYPDHVQKYFPESEWKKIEGDITGGTLEDYDEDYDEDWYEDYEYDYDHGHDDKFNSDCECELPF